MDKLISLKYSTNDSGCMCINTEFLDLDWFKNKYKREVATLGTYTENMYLRSVLDMPMVSDIVIFIRGDGSPFTYYEYIEAMIDENDDGEEVMLDAEEFVYLAVGTGNEVVEVGSRIDTEDGEDYKDEDFPLKYLNILTRSF